MKEKWKILNEILFVFQVPMNIIAIILCNNIPGWEKKCNALSIALFQANTKKYCDTFLSFALILKKSQILHSGEKWKLEKKATNLEFKRYDF